MHGSWVRRGSFEGLYDRFLWEVLRRFLQSPKTGGSEEGRGHSSAALDGTRFCKETSTRPCNGCARNGLCSRVRPRPVGITPARIQAGECHMDGVRGSLRVGNGSQRSHHESRTRLSGRVELPSLRRGNTRQLPPATRCGNAESTLAEPPNHPPLSRNPLPAASGRPTPHQ